MIADEFLSIYDASDAVAVVVDAGPEQTWDALMNVDLIAVGRSNPLAGILGTMRMLPELASHPLRDFAEPGYAKTVYALSVEGLHDPRARVPVS
jgi:hypothetical protein